MAHMIQLSGDFGQFGQVLAVDSAWCTHPDGSAAVSAFSINVS